MRSGRLRRALAAVARPCLLLAAAVAGCSSGVEPAGPELARVLIEPDPEYERWWSELEACAGIEADFARLRFFEVISPLYYEGRQFPCGPAARCNGMWERPHDVTLAPAYLLSERLVKHEMLHDLLGSVDHPPVFEACGADWPLSDLR